MKTVPRPDDEAVVKITCMLGRRSVELLQRTLLIKASALDMCAERVFSKATSEIRQTTLDSSFCIQNLYYLLPVCTCLVVGLAKIIE